MIEQPIFRDFYAALNGREPFPWQERLALSLAAGHGWPAEIGIPTGLGKTSCLDIAVWWLASQADREPVDRVAPTRIWWLVNRRLLVDSTTDHAQRMVHLLESVNADVPLRAVAERLRSLSSSPTAPPLEVIRLRGGITAARPSDPSQPAIVLSTLPMYGSRLLFRGYGSSRSMRPIDAAHAGTDSLVLVDEAHLARHLMNLFDPLDACDRRAIDVLPAARRRPSVVSLTATGAANETNRFDLDDDDRAHPVVQQRLHARKPMQLEVLAARSDPSKAMAQAVADLLGARGEPSSCIVFVNTPDTARRVEEAIDRALGADACDVVVLTGRQRDRESVEVRRRILDVEDGAPVARHPAPRDHHLIVIATQTLEVGADVDFEYLVTEACGVRALTQRLGRLNRLGRFDHAEAVYVHAEPPARGTADPAWPVYGAEPLAVLERLRKACEAGPVDVGPAVVAAVLGEPGDDPGRAPEVLPGLLWEWVKTTVPPAGEAPVEPYFSGLARPTRRLSVCWRAFVPTEPGAVLWPRVRDSEVIELPLDELGGALAEDAELVRLRPDRVSTEPVAAGDLRPGDTLILPVTAGKLDEHGWNPSAVPTVADVSLPRNGIPLDSVAIERIVHSPPLVALRALLDDDDPEPQVGCDLLGELVAQLAACEPIALSPGEWTSLVENVDLDRGVVAPRGEIPRLVVKRDAPQSRADSLDELSAGGRAVPLDVHGADVDDRARSIAEALGVAANLADLVGRSARFHDTGKADERFQRWLDPRSSASEPLAKSATPTSQWRADRIASGWPAGGRHEELSCRLVRQWLSRRQTDSTMDLDEDLLLHLVVSHHGHGRPFLSPVVDTTSRRVTSSLDGVDVEVEADLSIPDWDQPDRFARLNARYGHWGLALLEAIVRQADHLESARVWAGRTEEII